MEYIPQKYEYLWNEFPKNRWLTNLEDGNRLQPANEGEPRELVASGLF